MRVLSCAAERLLPLGARCLFGLVLQSPALLAIGRLMEMRWTLVVFWAGAGEAQGVLIGTKGSGGLGLAKEKRLEERSDR